jgi:diguanylate cyclase (GGDEF)-like protein
MFELSQAKKGLVLIIDDSRMNQQILSAMLEGIAEVHCASLGEEGIMLAQALHPNLILLDVEMPGMDGYEVCRALKQNPSFDSAIMFVTSHTSEEHEIRALRAGAVDFVTKPFKFEIVKARVSAHLLLNMQTHFLRNLVNYDGLTGVFNRRHFDDMLDQEWRRHLRTQASLALAMIDVDFFKRYNDRAGHQAGDDCLKAVARCLSQNTRRPGEIVTRYGGEEFAVILPATAAEDALKYGQWLCQQFALLAMPHPDRDDGLDIVTVSVGLSAVVPSMAGESKLLVRAADSALYRAKRSGRNNACIEHVSDPDA